MPIVEDKPEYALQVSEAYSYGADLCLKLEEDRTHTEDCVVLLTQFIHEIRDNLQYLDAEEQIVDLFKKKGLL